MCTNVSLYFIRDPVAFCEIAQKPFPKISGPMESHFLQQIIRFTCAGKGKKKQVWLHLILDCIQFESSSILLNAEPSLYGSGLLDRGQKIYHIWGEGGKREGYRAANGVNISVV